MWSLGLVVGRSWALSAGSVVLAQGLDRKPNPVRQQLREFGYAAPAKRGGDRRAVVGETCFAPVLKWGLSWGEGPQLALAVDARTLGHRFGVLALRVLYRGCALPVAWTLLPAGQQHAWRREGLGRLRQVRAAIPRRFVVSVLADRGLSARGLLRRIVRRGWHLLWRVNTAGTFRPVGSARYRPLRRFVPQPGTQWGGRGTAFVGPRRRRNCTLLARGDAGYTEPWLRLPDRAPRTGAACGYGLRAGIAQGFKLTKRAGWPWHRTRMRDPQRAARVWVAVAVATWWLLSVGGAAEERIPVGRLPLLPTNFLSLPRQRQATRLRLVSVFRQG